METQYISLNMTPSGVNPIFHISQYDVGRLLGFYVYNGSEVVDLDDYTCTVEATRTDGTQITTNVITNNNSGIFAVTATMSNVADKYNCQLVIVDRNTNRVASLPFIMDVVTAALNGNDSSIYNDRTLYQQYNASMQAALANEANNRINADNLEKATRQSAVNTLQAALANEANNRINADNLEKATRQSAVNTLQGNINSEASTRASADSNLQSQINQIVAPSGEAPSVAEVQNARIGADGRTYGTLGDAIRGQVTDLKSSVGQWYYTYNAVNSRYPRIQVNTFGARMYFQLVTPTENVSSVYLLGSNDNWATQTQIYTQSVSVDGFSYYVDIPEGYTSLRFNASMVEPYTGAFSAIIHTVDNYSIGQNILDIKNDIKDINQTVTSSLSVISEQMTGTNYNGFYLNTAPVQGIRSISNTSFNVRAYPVNANETYYLRGMGISLNAALPLAAFGVAEVVDKNNYVEKIIDGSTTPTDYSIEYTPTINGYIYVAWVSGKNEISVFNSQEISKQVNKLINPSSIKIQLFGDSITDNQWGDKKTWADYITEFMPQYTDITIINDSVGGSGIGHGKSTTTESHQTDEYNYVWDLVTNGTTLQTDADAVVILVGTNNWASSTAVGDMSSTGYGTIYGALKGIIEYISTHSTATVFVCTIPQRYDSADQSKPTNSSGEPLDDNNVSLAEFCAPFEKVSAFYGMPCVHLNTALGWNRLNVSNFTTDGLHPNTVGDKMLAKFICSEIMKHI